MRIQAQWKRFIHRRLSELSVGTCQNSTDLSQDRIYRRASVTITWIGLWNGYELAICEDCALYGIRTLWHYLLRHRHRSYSVVSMEVGPGYCILKREASTPPGTVNRIQMRLKRDVAERCTLRSDMWKDMSVFQSEGTLSVGAARKREPCLEVSSLFDAQMALPTLLHYPL